MKLTTFLSTVGIALLSISCGAPQVKFSKKITVTNPLPSEREAETISILMSEIGQLPQGVSADQLVIKDQAGDLKVTQLIDQNQDGTPESIIFQSDLKSEESVTFELTLKAEGDSISNGNLSTYARFVPERVDDIAWENDRIAFRTYGPEAQRLVEVGEEGGTLSSGIDCWLKRVDYPIINKWYKKYTDGGTYHVDSGEGLDNYHVGTSRGCGGIAIKEDGQTFVSKNFTHYSIIANGPIRTIFTLSYEPWSIHSKTVQETKTFSIDLGSSFYQQTVDLGTESQFETIQTGIALHDKTGDYVANDNGWIRYWETMPDSSELGTAVIAPSTSFIETFTDISNEEDMSHIWMTLKPEKNIVNFYIGYGWAKSNLFASATEWDSYIEKYAERINNPCTIVIE